MQNINFSAVFCRLDGIVLLCFEFLQSAVVLFHADSVFTTVLNVQKNCKWLWMQKKNEKNIKNDQTVEGGNGQWLHNWEKTIVIKNKRIKLKIEARTVATIE